MSDLEDEFLSSPDEPPVSSRTESGNVSESLDDTQINSRKDENVKIQIKLDFSNPKTKENVKNKQETVVVPTTSTGDSSIRNTSPIEVLENTTKNINVNQCSPPTQQNRDTAESKRSHRPHENVHLWYVQSGDIMPTSGYSGSILHDGMMQSVRRSNLTGKWEVPSEDYDAKVSALIHQLVLEKYQNVLKKFRERRMKRLRNSPLFRNLSKEHCQQSLRHWNGAETANTQFDLGFDSIRHHSPGQKSSLRETNNSQMNFTIPEDDKCLDSGNYTSLESLRSKTDDEHEPTVENHEQQILPMAMDEGAEETSFPIRSTHYYTTPAEYTLGKSVGSSNISSLVSAIDNRKSVYSYYSPVLKRKNQRKQNLISKTGISNVSNENDYESLTNWRISNREEILIQQLDIQREIIRQVCNALTVARKTPKLFGWEIIAETEKLLCVASYRKDTIAGLLTQTMTDEKHNNCVTATIRISNMKFFSSDSRIHSKNYKKNKQYFMCILHSESTILDSELVVPRGNEILFEEHFQFDDTSPEFEITINLFSLNEMPQKVKKKINIFGRKNKPSTIAPSQSSFVSWGKTIVKPTVLQETPTVLSLSKIPEEANISSSFTADIVIS